MKKDREDTFDNNGIKNLHNEIDAVIDENDGYNSDIINISELELARIEVSKIPDIREEKVKELKRLYDLGEYEIDPKKIANKILEKNGSNGIK